MKEEMINTLNCDLETGICEVPNDAELKEGGLNKKPVKLLYFTDPICSSCWGIEPQIRKLKQDYGNYFDIEYRMGGLLKSWSEYGGSDVNGPGSVAKHWEEAGAFYEMPIDGGVWNEDPLDSSYPPAMAFKAAQLQDRDKADRFLRRIKEMVFTEKKNITQMQHLVQAAGHTGLNVTQFISDYTHKAKQLLQEDLSLAQAWGVRGFPTIYFIDGEDNRFKVYGSKPYRVYEQTLLKLLPGAPRKNVPPSYETILKGYDTVTLKEFAVYYDKDASEAQMILDELERQGKVKQVVSKAGSLWRVTH